MKYNTRVKVELFNRRGIDNARCCFFLYISGKGVDVYKASAANYAIDTLYIGMVRYSNLNRTAVDVLS